MAHLILFEQELLHSKFDGAWSVIFIINELFYCLYCLYSISIIVPVELYFGYFNFMTMAVAFGLAILIQNLINLLEVIVIMCLKGFKLELIIN